MALDLTPMEVIRLAQALSAIPEGLAIVNENDELALWHQDEHTISMAEKVNEEGNREDVQAYIAEHFGSSAEEDEEDASRDN